MQADTKPVDEASATVAQVQEHLRRHGADYERQVEKTRADAAKSKDKPPPR